MRSRRPRALAAALAVAGSLTLLRAQTPAPAATPQQPQFIGRADVVQVDVSVLDKAGKPVTDLTIADFEIREDGAAQKIGTLALLTADPAFLPDATAPGAGAQLPSDPASGVVVRRLPPRIFVFALDLAHLSATGFDRTRTAIRSFLDDGLRPGDLAGVVVEGKMLGNQIIADKERLLTLLADVKLPSGMTRYAELRQWPKIIDEEEAYRIAVRRLPEALDAALRRACTERAGECDGAGGTARAAIEAQIESKAAKVAGESQVDAVAALNVLKALANGLGRFPGPKHVLLFSEGFYTGEHLDRVTELSGLAAQNNVRISTLDARGLATDPRMDNLLGESPLLSTGDHVVLGNDVNADVLATLAYETGGERVRNRNILRPALDRIADISGTYYLLGYSPATPFDGKYRRIEVKVKRPGVTVVARRGYLAIRRPATTDSPAPADAAANKTVAAAPIAPPPLTAGRDRVRLEETRAAVSERLAAPSGADAPNAAATALAREGWALFGEGNVEAARDKLAAASAQGAGVWADYALALSEFTLRNVAAAAALWERIRQAEPGYEPLYFDLADAYLTTGRLADAVSLLREATRRWPKDPDTHNALGLVLFKRGASDDALESFERAVAVAPEDGVGWLNLGTAVHARYIRRLNGSAGERSLGSRDKARAIQCYQKYLAIGGPYESQVRSALTALGWSGRSS